MTDYLTPAVSIRNLRKTYDAGKNSPPKEALKSISLDIPQGSIFGLLGANGAGKSTMINIMAGLVTKTSGTVEVCGYDIEKQMRMARLSLGVVPQELVLDSFFTVREALDIHAGYYGVPKSQRRTNEIIDAIGLTDKADDNSRRLSGGMKRRLLIGKALVHNPKVLVLDEPTAGVDVELRNHLWNYVRELNASGTTILLTTHYLEEAEELCDEIAILNNGEIIAHESKDDLVNSLDNKQISVEVEPKLTSLPPALGEYGWKLQANGKLSIDYCPSKIDVETLLAQIRGDGLHISDLSTSEADLEDVFMNLTAA